MIAKKAQLQLYLAASYDVMPWAEGSVHNTITKTQFFVQPAIHHLMHQKAENLAPACLTAPTVYHAAT